MKSRFGKRAIEMIESFDRVNALTPRAYYVPFGNEPFTFKHGILDRTASSRFISLDGEWKVREYARVTDVDLAVAPKNSIPVPSCVQCHGYDRYEYLAHDYPIPFDPPHVPQDNPTYHYRREFELGEVSEKYYLNFEGVDSGAFVFLNGEFAGYAQIAHAINEFDVTALVKVGVNVLDVVVVKWSAATYVEDQDKFRFTGIFRSVYLLHRPEKHITDFKIASCLEGGNGYITVDNLSDVPIYGNVAGKEVYLLPDEQVDVEIENATPWSAEDPVLYDVVLECNGEKILQRVGIRTVEIKDGVFKLNGKHIKLKGVNRHDSHPKTGSTVTLEDMVRDLELMKWANVNAVRTSHYPPCPEFCQLCDAMGVYIMDEADVELHGVIDDGMPDGTQEWVKYASGDYFKKSITDREINLYERDKNVTSVIIWSLGNESCYGAAFFDGVDYIKAHDTRPVHYEGIVYNREHYYDERIDIVSRMYPELTIFDAILADERETRPFVMCEYSHSMGNSNGDLNDYWKIIDGNDRFMGAFIWEWCDHAVWSERGYLYGGDWGEAHHNSNICVDGLVSPDRKIKSNLLEARAVYGGARESEFVAPVATPKPLKDGTPVAVEADTSGRITKLGELPLAAPVSINITRAYLDNDKHDLQKWNRFLSGAKQVLDGVEQDGNAIRYSGKIVKDGFLPALRYVLTVEPYANGAKVTLDYRVGEHIDFLSRIGIEFALSVPCDKFTYCGYGPSESYCDKHLHAHYGEFESTASANYDHNYIKPQENGSHFACTALSVADVMSVTATAPFSMSVLPYSTAEIASAKHDFELPESDKVWVNLDLFMSGVGSGSCGPRLNEKYRAPKQGKNTFIIEIQK